jgi:sortase A
MLSLKSKKSSSVLPKIMTVVGVLLFCSGLYLLTLVGAPVIMPYVMSSSIDPAKLESPKQNDNRIIIPKIGVNISYGEGEKSLNNGAWWRYPERGNPEKGGNFILAAHRFEIQPTPQATWEKSPFYRIEQLSIGDEVIVDYNGKRYGYKIDERKDVKPDQIEIEAASQTPKLTLYSCTLGGAKDGRIVLIAKPLGEVTIKNNPQPTS